MSPCDACGGDLYQFEPGQGVRIDPRHLPVVCRRCGRATVDGKELAVPKELQKATAKIAEAAAQHGKDAREALLKDPALRVEKYFEKVYQRGYLDGFLRAVAYSQHHVKEGRIRRLRTIWQEAIHDTPYRKDGQNTVIVMHEFRFKEFSLLLEKSGIPKTEGESSADRPQNPDSSGTTR